jgi:hypothetical protein
MPCPFQSPTREGGDNPRTINFISGERRRRKKKQAKPEAPSTKAL